MNGRLLCRAINNSILFLIIYRIIIRKIGDCKINKFAVIFDYTDILLRSKSRNNI